MRLAKISLALHTENARDNPGIEVSFGVGGNLDGAAYRRHIGNVQWVAFSFRWLSISAVAGWLDGLAVAIRFIGWGTIYQTLKAI